jgi:hypothetical protein
MAESGDVYDTSLLAGEDSKFLKESGLIFASLPD